VAKERNCIYAQSSSWRAVLRFQKRISVEITTFCVASPIARVSSVWRPPVWMLFAFAPFGWKRVQRSRCLPNECLSCGRWKGVYISFFPSNTMKAESVGKVAVCFRFGSVEWTEPFVSCVWTAGHYQAGGKWCVFNLTARVTELGLIVICKRTTHSLWFKTGPLSFKLERSKFMAQTKLLGSSYRVGNYFRDGRTVSFLTFHDVSGLWRKIHRTLIAIPSS